MNKLEHPLLQPVYAGAVVIANDGSILCQLRDNKPGIIYPGHWSCAPGGHVEADELPGNAIIRELFEEFEIRVTGLEKFATLVETEENIIGTYHAYSAYLSASVDQVVCNEGVKVEFFCIEEALRLKQHPVSKKILLEFIKRKRFEINH